MKPKYSVEKGLSHTHTHTLNYSNTMEFLKKLYLPYHVTGQQFRFMEEGGDATFQKKHKHLKIYTMNRMGQI